MTENTTAPAGGDTPSTPEQAVTRIAELKADAGWSERYLKGDPSALATMRQLNELAYDPGSNAAPGYQAAVRAQNAEALRSFADLPQDVVQQIRDGRAVSREEYQLALDAKRRMTTDREFVKRYLDGGQAERKQMTLVSIVLGSPLAPQ